jgi:hypothetical protein
MISKDDDVAAETVAESDPDLAGIPGRGSHVQFFETGRNWTVVANYFKLLLSICSSRNNSSSSGSSSSQQQTTIPAFIFGSNPLYTMTDLEVYHRAAADSEFVSADPRYKRKTFALRIGYDGSAYTGYQMQKGCGLAQPTVEDDLRAALGGRTNIVAAGRTDKGVSALSQIVSFSTFEEDVTEESIMSSFAANLAPERRQYLVCSQCYRVPRKFHALFTATWRRYLYMFPLKEGTYPASVVGQCQGNGVGADVDVDFIRTALQMYVG